MTKAIRYQACVRVELTVDFIDNGEDELLDQAIDAARMMILPIEGDPVEGIEIVGKIDSYETETDDADA